MDLALNWISDEFHFDLSVVAQDIERDDGVRTAVVISLFSDARITAEEKPDEKSALRGWWGDMFPDVERDKIGSRLWLLSRSKQTTDTLNRAKEYCQEALKWLTDDGIAEAVTVETEFVSRGVLGIKVDVKRPRANVALSYAFNWAFEELRG